uniref:Uncharacterized protein n=1 Tax=Ditylenchus dipsaci TaxID=166011 RepID=A0A915CL77_9BILA
MPQKLTASAKTKEKKRALCEIEDAKDLTHDIERSMTEGLFRISWDALRVIKERACVMIRSETYRPAVKEKTIAWARKYGSSAVAKKFEVDVFGEYKKVAGGGEAKSQ